MSASLIKQISTLKSGDHACLFYASPEEQFAAVLPYIKAGLAQNEKCLYIVDDNHVLFVLEAMDDAGIDINAALAARSFCIHSKHQTYYKQGSFRPDVMINGLKSGVEEALSEGYSGFRVTGEMTWALSDPKALDQLMAYETKLDEFFPSQLTGLCQYNQNRFAAESISGVLQTHRLVIANGKLQSNKFYLPPEQKRSMDYDEASANETFAQLQNAKPVKSSPESKQLSSQVLPQVSRVVPISKYSWRA